MPRRPASKWHGVRALLNKPGFQSTAAIVAEIEDTSTWTDGKDSDGESFTRWSRPLYTLQISNCDRSIAFDIDFATPESRRNDLHKIDTMIGALQKFRDGLVVEQERHKQRQRLLKDSDV